MPPLVFSIIIAVRRVWLRLYEEIILPYDTIKFSESEFNGIPYKNTNMDGKLTIAQFQDGSLVTVWPFDIAKHDTIYPAPFN